MSWTCTYCDTDRPDGDFSHRHTLDLPSRFLPDGPLARATATTYRHNPALVCIEGLSAVGRWVEEWRRVDTAELVEEPWQRPS